MNINLVAMPHMIEKPGDVCICQSVIDAHPGNYWLHYRLPKTDPARIYEAVRVQVPPFDAERMGPRILPWNGSITRPTIGVPLSDEDGSLWLLRNGEMVPVSLK